MANKKTITITQKVLEIVYDIQNKAYLTGQSREADGKSFVSASNMQASDDAENGYQIRRSLANAFSTLKSNLGEYLQENSSTSNNLINTAIESNGELTLTLIMPSNYNEASVDSLGNNIHSYLVDMALTDWFAITDKEDVKVYVDHAAISLENIKRALYKRCRPSRPIYT